MEKILNKAKVFLENMKKEDDKYQDFFDEEIVKIERKNEESKIEGIQ